MFYIRNVLFAALVLVLFTNNRQASERLETIKTESGPISGTVSKDGNVHVYKGIPYAAPPVGDLRWRAPQPARPWRNVRKCADFGPSPMQAAPVPFSMWSQEFLIPKSPINEDCLYLNVWTGAHSAKERRPVLVWIYGGGFASGGSAVPIYDGEAMARKGIIFVSVNYRVGVFGFFAHPELSQESPWHAPGNYGLMDQIAALRWVQKNIDAFGGDPRRVTIAGQSAGSMSVNCLVASPEAKGLFIRAIGESGASFSQKMTTLQQAELEGTKLATRLQATSISDLRKLNAEELLRKTQGRYGPIVDGYVLPASVSSIFAQQKENPVSLLTGWNEQEGLMFGPVKNASEYQKDMQAQYGTDAAMALRWYPPTNDTEAAASQLKLSRDLIFGIHNYTWANLTSKAGQEVYLYRFTRRLPATGEYKKYGAFHTGEVPYAYNNLKFVNRPWDPVDHKLAAAMSTYWSNFVKYGDPNGNGLPLWPAYDAKRKEVMVLGNAVIARPLWDSASLDFLCGRLLAGN